MTGGIRNVCILVVEFASTSTNSATMEAFPPLEPLGTAMLRTILVVQLRLSLELEFFSHFSSFHLEMMWTSVTWRVRKEETMKMIRVIQGEGTVIFGGYTFQVSAIFLNIDCACKTERKRFGSFFCGPYFFFYSLRLSWLFFTRNRKFSKKNKK